jgi:hypothetical protein
MKCKFHARHAMARKQQILWYLAHKMAMMTTAVWAKSRTLAQFGRDFTHHKSIVTALTRSCDGLAAATPDASHAK